MILVTGGTGLVGTHLLFDLVKQGHRVRALKRSSSNLDSIRAVFRYYEPNRDNLFEQIEWVVGDVTDIHTILDALDDVTQVYHCAALVSFDPRDAKQLYLINVEGTANVVNACLDKGVDKLCHVSSTAAIGRAKGQTNIDESSEWKTSKENTNYAISKFGAEREVWRGTQEGLDAVIVNPSIIVGPGNWEQSSASVFKTIWKGLKFYTEGVNGFVDVRDVSRAMINLMESDISLERYLVVGENLTFREFFAHVAKSMDKPVPGIGAKRWMTEIVWRLAKLGTFFTGKASAITRESSRSAHNRYFYSHEKLELAIDFKFTSIEEAARNAGTFFKKAATK